jgi:hypothetical protein
MYFQRVFQSAMFVVWFGIVHSSEAVIMETVNMDDTSKRFVLTDGSVIELRSVKEGKYQWFESRDGYSVVRTLDRYEYAFQSEDGGITASGVLAGESKPKLPFPSGIRPTPEFLRKKRTEIGTIGSQPSPNPISVVQPDGRKLDIYLKGGASYSWYEDMTGYTIVMVPGRVEYAVRNPDGALIGCGVEVEAMKPSEAGLTPGIRPGTEFLRKHNNVPIR